MSLSWYVVHSYSGYENQVKRSLEDRIVRGGMESKFGKILVPTEEVVEMKDGQKRKSDRNAFYESSSNHEISRSNKRKANLR